jgi:nicotinate-nucleotide adenylyltransferase
MSAAQRIGILGGSFDPPHAAHTTMAVTARATLGLARVLLVPASLPPHKEPSRLTPYALRLEMLEAAVEGVAGVEVAPLEEGREGPSYTVDLLRAFRAAHPRDDVYFIVGADSLRDLGAWRDPEGVLASCTLAVFPREGVDTALAVPGPASLVVFESPLVPISSTDIRARARAGASLAGLVAPAVEEIIRSRGLYADG